ncbi:MAG: toxin-antitoxin system protein [Isosphaerales bacterium]
MKEASDSFVMKAMSPGHEEMASLTVRISRSTHAALRALAEETDESMTEILDKAIEIYRRQRFLAGLNADFAALRKNKAAWEEELAERALWDAALTDGLED